MDYLTYSYENWAVPYMEDQPMEEDNELCNNETLLDGISNEADEVLPIGIYHQTEVEEMESYNHINLSGCSPTNTMLLENHNLTELNSGSFASNIPWPEMPRLLYPTNRPSPLAELPIPPDSLVITEDSPLERWYSSSSEDEGCTIKALATVASSLLPPELHATRADISSGSSLGSARSIGSHQSLSSRRKQRYLSRTTTTAALAIDTDTIQPKEEEEQEPNLVNGPSKGKAKAKAKHKTAPSGPKEQNKYQCTFCTATFTTKGNWNRHEASVHLLSDTWICAPDGPWDKKKNGACVFCQKPPNTASVSHDSCAHACTDKSIQTRTFSRRDHLDQHLLHIHHVNNTKTRVIHSWKRSRKLPKESRCGFCDMKFTDWKERNSHIARHFEEDCTMSNWMGDWGLEEEWSVRLSSVTLPEERPRE